MARPLDPRIREILLEHGEDPDDKQGVIWDCHGTWVVYHRAIERIAAKAGVVFDPPTILRAERDEAVILVHGELKGRRDWDIGECLVGVNYRVSQRQAAYVWAMATKRARDRLVLKLIGLHGLLYSEEEADDFKEARPRNGNSEVKSSRQAKKDGDWAELGKLDDCESSEALLRWVPVKLSLIQQVPVAWQDETRELWGKALAEKIAGECQTPAEVKHWGVEFAKLIEALPPEWVSVARHVCSEHLKALRGKEDVLA